jgi:uncharacterized protein YaeQ
MGLATIYRFHLNLSDIDRSVYESLDLRLALHPSESISYLLTRLIAFALNVQPGLEFSKGLSDPDEPCISSEDPKGGKDLWIDIGNPSARRLHKAAKAAKRIKVYTYKNPVPYLKELENEKIHNLDKIEIFSINPDFFTSLEGVLEKNNEWTLLRNQGSISINIGDESYSEELVSHSIGR